MSSSDTVEYFVMNIGRLGVVCCVVGAVALSACRSEPREPLPQPTESSALEPTPIPTPTPNYDEVRLPGDISRFCDGPDAVYTYSRYKTGAAIVIVEGSHACQREQPNAQ